VRGDIVVAGAYKDEEKRGSAYIFTRDIAGAASSSWHQRAKLISADGAAGDRFGRSVAVC